MKNKTIAIFGIGTYILSVITSATDLEGNARFPIALIAVSEILKAIFTIMATIRLWKEARLISIILMSSAIIFVILTAIQEVVLPKGSLIIFLMNISKTICFIAFIWAIIKLYKGFSPVETKNAGDEGYFKAIVSSLRWNLTWFIPVSIWVISRFVIPNAISAYQNFSLFFHEKWWLALLSPSAYIFEAAAFASVLSPLQLLSYIPVFFVNDPENSSYKRRYLWAACLVILIPISCVLIQYIIWGSFPFHTDKQGYGHLRMIPFIPWPQSPFF